MYRTIFMMLALTTLCAPLDAQQQDSLLRPGDRIRISVPQAYRAPVVGILVARAPDVLTIARSGSKVDTVDIPISLIRTVEVSRGGISQRQGVRRGLMRGLAAGVMVGAIFGGVQALGVDAGDGASTNEFAEAAKMAVKFGAIGVAAGGILGLREREDWDRFVLPMVSLGGARKPLSLAFSLKI